MPFGLSGCAWPGARWRRVFAFLFVFPLAFCCALCYNSVVVGWFVAPFPFQPWRFSWFPSFLVVVVLWSFRPFVLLVIPSPGLVSPVLAWAGAGSRWLAGGRLLVPAIRRASFRAVVVPLILPFWVGSPMLQPSPVLIGGSRALLPASPAWAACQSFAVSVAASRPVHVGCAAGADSAAALALVSSPSLRVFSAFASSGAGAFSGSAVSVVQAAALAGVPVSWLAGGGLAVPLAARLMARSLAALAGCSSAFFFAPGVGSLKVARAALRAGVPVFISRTGLAAAPVLPIAPSPASVLGFQFWHFAPPVQVALF